MFKISFSDGLAVVGIVATIVLVALDKAGKLKGPLPVVLLAIAALMMLPLALGNPWVSEATGVLQFARGALMVFGIGLVFSALVVWISPDNNPSSLHPDLTKLDSSAKEAYQRFAAEKVRRISSYTQGGFLQLKMTALLGQNKAPRLQNNTGLGAAITATNSEYEQWLVTNAEAESNFQSALAAIRISWPSDPELVQLIETAKQPYRVHLEEAPPLDKIEDESRWLKDHSEQLNAEFAKKVTDPLEKLEKYLDEGLSRDARRSSQ